MPRRPGYLRAAFLLRANLVGLAVAGLSTAVTGELSLLLLAAGAEGVYLGVLSAVPRFQRLVRAQAGAWEGQETVEALLEELGPSQRQHYWALRELKDRILTAYRKLPGGGVIAAASAPRLDTLLSSFLRLLSTLNSYRQYLSAADRQAVEKEVSTLRADVESETHPRIREVKVNRLGILERRLERLASAEESREVVSHQLAGIEDLLRLTHEQAIAIRDPEVAARQLESLTAEASATQEAVQQMERFLELSEEASPPLPHGTRVR